MPYQRPSAAEAKVLQKLQKEEGAIINILEYEDDEIGDNLFVVAAIRRHRWERDFNSTRRVKWIDKYLIRWRGFGPDEDTWEPAANLIGSKDLLDRYKEKYGVEAQRPDGAARPIDVELPAAEALANKREAQRRSIEESSKHAFQGMSDLFDDQSSSNGAQRKDKGKQPKSSSKEVKGSESGRKSSTGKEAAKVVKASSSISTPASVKKVDRKSVEKVTITAQNNIIYDLTDDSDEEMAVAKAETPSSLSSGRNSASSHDIQSIKSDSRLATGRNSSASRDVSISQSDCAQRSASSASGRNSSSGDVKSKIVPSDLKAISASAVVASLPPRNRESAEPVNNIPDAEVINIEDEEDNADGEDDMDFLMDFKFDVSAVDAKLIDAVSNADLSPSILSPSTDSSSPPGGSHVTSSAGGGHVAVSMGDAAAEVSLALSGDRSSSASPDLLDQPALGIEKANSGGHVVGHVINKAAGGDDSREAAAATIRTPRASSSLPNIVAVSSASTRYVAGGGGDGGLLAIARNHVEDRRGSDVLPFESSPSPIVVDDSELPTLEEFSDSSGSWDDGGQPIGFEGLSRDDRRTMAAAVNDLCDLIAEIENAKNELVDLTPPVPSMPVLPLPMDDIDIDVLPEITAPEKTLKYHENYLNKATGSKNALFSHAVRAGKLPVVLQMLKENNANANKENTSDYEKLDLEQPSARGRVTLLMICALKASSSESDQVFIEIAAALIRKSAKMDARTKSDWTALMISANTGCEAMLNALLQYGSLSTDLLHATNSDGETALFMAGRRGHVECLTSLIAAGANISHENKNGETALAVARAAKQTSTERILAAFTAKLSKAFHDTIASTLSSNCALHAPVLPVQIFSLSPEEKRLKFSARLDALESLFPELNAQPCEYDPYGVILFAALVDIVILADANKQKSSEEETTFKITCEMPSSKGRSPVSGVIVNGKNQTALHANKSNAWTFGDLRDDAYVANLFEIELRSMPEDFYATPNKKLIVQPWLAYDPEQQQSEEAKREEDGSGSVAAKRKFSCLDLA